MLKDKRVLRWSVIAISSISVALSSWAVSSPVASGPDDDFHLASVWCGQGVREGLCEESSTPGYFLVPGTVVFNSSCFASQPDKSGLCQEIDGLLETNRLNSSNNSYPPIYYWTMSWFATDAVEASVIRMRIFSILFAVGILSLVVASIPLHLRRVPVVAAVTTLIPLGAFLVASNNPSGVASISVIAFFASVIGLFSVSYNKQRIPLIILASISFVTGAGSREDTGAYLIFAGGLAWLLASEIRTPKKSRLLIGAGIAVGAVAFMTVAFFSSSFVGYFLRGADWFGGVNTLGTTVRNLITLPDLWVGAFGTWGLGWLDTPLPSSVWVVTFGVYFALAFGSIRSFGRRQAFATSLVFIALVVVPMYTLSVNGLSVGQIVQPRYLLPLIGLLIATAAYRSSIEGGMHLSRGQIWLIGIGLFGANAISLHTNLRRYLTGLDENQVSLNFEIEWWWVQRPSPDAVLWLSPNYVWLVGSLAFGLFLFSMWKLRFELGLISQVNFSKKTQRPSTEIENLDNNQAPEGGRR
jgi:hypothetical protein